MNKLAYTLITLAVINITFAPATAMETNLVESWNSTSNLLDGMSQIKSSTETNFFRRCIYISWVRMWWCFSWGDDDD